MKKIKFSGYNWEVRNYDGGPGPNKFSDTLAWVDKKGYLHLKIAKIGGVYNCAEVYLDKPLGYGTYTFEVEKRMFLDKRAVLGLFTYEDDENEIDIEFSRWGFCLAPNFQFVVQPTIFGSYKKYYSFSKISRSSFQWMPHAVSFKSNVWPSKPEWIFDTFDTYSPQSVGKERVHLNLWLFQGKAPKQEQEVIIKKFKFIKPSLKTQLINYKRRRRAIRT